MAPRASESGVATSLLRVEDTEGSLFGIWGRIVFWCVVSCGTLHGIFGLVVSVKLVTDLNARSLLVPVIYFVVGALYAFIRCLWLAMAIALVHYSIADGLELGELAFYVLVLTMLCMFFSSGRVPNLYAL